MHYLSAQSNAFKGSAASVKAKILAGYKGKIDDSYPEILKEIIAKLVQPDPNERADYHEIAKYDEINKHFRNIVGISEEEKL